MFAVTKQAGQCMAMPDVCKVPSPGGPVPTPFVNLAMPMMANGASQKVHVCGSPALNKASKIPSSNGDEPGSAGGGVSSAKIIGECEFTMGSKKVNFEGHPVVRLSDGTRQNNGNAIGNVTVPSQSKVLIKS